MSLTNTLKIVTVLSKTPGFVNSFELSEETGFPTTTIEVYIKPLRLNGFVKTKKGPNGGYRLAMPLKSIKISDFVNAVKPGNLFIDSLLKNSKVSYLSDL